MSDRSPTQIPAVDTTDLDYSFGSPPLDWRQAVRAATARLNEGWELPETRCHSAAEEELAVFLCAYNVLVKEVDRMQAGVTATSMPPLE